MKSINNTLFDSINKVNFSDARKPKLPTLNYIKDRPVGSLSWHTGDKEHNLSTKKSLKAAHYLLVTVVELNRVASKI